MHIRFRFAKLGKVRFTSQRDVARMWERALRRVRLPLAYTEGFSPRPRLSFGLALPTGCESEAEYLDVVLDDRRPEVEGLDVDALAELLTPRLPEGIEVRDASRLGPGLGSLQQLVTSCSWTVDVAGVTRDQLEAGVAALLAARSVPVTRERKGRPVRDDLRPAVLSLAVVERPVPTGAAAPYRSTVRLETELATQPRGIRPPELLAALASPGAEAPGAGTAEATAPHHGVGHQGTPVLDRACRTHQWIVRDAIRAEPLEWARRAEADRAGYAWERAS